MFRTFMSEVIDRESFKKVLSEQAMLDFSEQPGVLLVHSPVLYRLYTLYHETYAEPFDTMEDRPLFYRKAGMYLYYERFTCNHGDEFYYYIKFNEKSEFYQEHRLLIETLIVANDPSTLLDYTGVKDVSGYNMSLKEAK